MGWKLLASQNMTIQKNGAAARRPPTPPFTRETVAGRFFEHTDLNDVFGITSADALWEWLRSGASKPVSGGARPIPTDGVIAYRGQSDASHGLTSSLYRMCRHAVQGSVFESDMARAEQKIIDVMRQEGVGRLMTDGQLLTVLQHHGVPTRLIDFSKAPLEALFFAVEDYDATDGRLFIVQSLPSRQGTKVDFEDNGTYQLPWQDVAHGITRASSDWTETAAIVPAGGRDPRMVAQQGVFLVGGLNRRYGGRTMSLHSRLIPADLYSEVTSAGINFRTRVSKGNNRWPAHGWTVRVKAEWKAELRGKLASLQDRITRDSMYPPVGEVKRLATYAAKSVLTKGTSPDVPERRHL